MSDCNERCRSPKCAANNVCTMSRKQPVINNEATSHDFNEPEKVDYSHLLIAVTVGLLALPWTFITVGVLAWLLNK